MQTESGKARESCRRTASAAARRCPGPRSPTIRSGSATRGAPVAAGGTRRARAGASHRRPSASAVAELRGELALLGQALERELQPDQRRVEPLPGVVVERRVSRAARGDHEIERAAHQVGRRLPLRAPIDAGLAVPSAPSILDLAALALEQPPQQVAAARAAPALRPVAPLGMAPALIVGHT